MGIADDCRERLGEHLEQLSLSDVHGSVVQAAVGESVPQEVFRGGHHTPVQVRPGGTAAAVVRIGLERPDVRDSQLPGQDRVLSVGLLDTPPPRVASDVQHRRQRLAGTDREHLGADVTGDGRQEFAVPGRGQADRLGELHRVARAEPGDGLLVQHGGDAEAGVVDEPLLDLVVQTRDSGRAQPGRRGDPCDLTCAVGQVLAGGGRREVVVAHEFGGPHAAELCELLGECHAAQQVVDAVLDRQRGVAVRRVVAHGSGQRVGALVGVVALAHAVSSIGGAGSGWGRH